MKHSIFILILTTFLYATDSLTMDQKGNTWNIPSLATLALSRFIKNNPTNKSRYKTFKRLPEATKDETAKETALIAQELGITLHTVMDLSDEEYKTCVTLCKQFSPDNPVEIEVISDKEIAVFQNPSKKSIDTSMELFKQTALLPEDIRKKFKDKEVVVYRTPTGKMLYVASRAIGGGLIGAGTGSLIGLVGPATAFNGILKQAMIASANAMYSPELTQPIADGIRNSLDTQKLEVPVLKYNIDHMPMLIPGSTSKAQQEIQDGFTMQITDHIHNQNPQLAQTIVNYGLESAHKTFNKNVAHPTIENVKDWSLYGSLGGTFVGFLHGIQSMNKPIIIIKISEIGDEQPRSMYEKVSHVALCTATGTVFGATAGASGVILANTSFGPTLCAVAIQQGIETLTDNYKNIISNTTKDIINNPYNQHQRNVLSVQGIKDNWYEFTEDGSIGSYVPSDTPTIQRQMADLTKEQLQNSSTIYATNITSSTWKDASNTMHTYLGRTFEDMKMSAAGGAIAGGTLGFLHGINTMNDAKQKSYE